MMFNKEEGNMKVLMIVLCSLMAGGCATGVSTYEYTRMMDGSAIVKVKSANEVKQMKMGINRETGTLEVEIGDMTKKSDTVEVINGVKAMIHDVTNPGGLPQ